MKLELAKSIGTKFVRLLLDNGSITYGGLCGSIRRNKPEVKDIEVVALPALVEGPTDLFKNPTKVRDPRFVSSVLSAARLVTGDLATGRYCKLMSKYGDVPIDLFLPEKDDFWRIVTIRTGCASFVRDVIAAAWVRKGWRGTEHGLRLEKECYKSKDEWICYVKNPTLPPAWQTEQEFWQWLGVDYLQPQFRTETGRKVVA